MKLHLRAVILVSCWALAMVWGSAGADEVPLITGEHWMKSSEQLKKVYLIGIANVVQVWMIVLLAFLLGIANAVEVENIRSLEIERQRDVQEKLRQRIESLQKQVRARTRTREE
jgi:uncharacterized protein YlxW (UPF0749 family)